MILRFLLYVLFVRVLYRRQGILTTKALECGILAMIDGNRSLSLCFIYCFMETIEVK